jgi:hypothetical protein
MIKAATTLFLCGLLSACGSGSEPADESANRAEPNAGEHMLSDQQRALQDAQSAADAMEEAAKARQQALDEAH